MPQLSTCGAQASSQGRGYQAPCARTSWWGSRRSTSSTIQRRCPARFSYWNSRYRRISTTLWFDLGGATSSQLRYRRWTRALSASRVKRSRSQRR